MIKTLFTFSLLALSLQLVSATEAPFRKSPQHPARQQVKKALAAPAAAMRSSSNETLPDSMHFSSWDNNAWQLEEVAGLRYDARGRMQHMLMYDQAGPASRQYAVIDYHYTPAGALRSYVFAATFAGLRREQFRLDFNYDTRGNKTSGLIRMPDSTGNMVAVFGDSIAYTYDQRNRVASATVLVLDFVNFTGWIPLQQIEQISWNGNGRPDAFESAYWDDVNQQWTDHRKFNQLQWGFGWNGFDRLFGTMRFDVDFSLYEPVDFRFDEPTDYLVQIFENGRWEDTELRDSEADGLGRITTIRNFYWGGNTWASSDFTQYAYNQHGIQTITQHLYDHDNGNFMPFEQIIYGYHTNGKMSFKEGLMYDGNRWQISASATYNYGLNAASQVANQLVRELDWSTQSFVNFSFTEFFYRQPVAASAREQARNLPLQAYPNPTQGSIQIILPEGTHEAEIRVRNLQGQLLLSQKQYAGNGNAQLSLENLPAGIYLVEAIAGSQHGALRIVKQ